MVTPRNETGGYIKIAALSLWLCLSSVCLRAAVPEDVLALLSHHRRSGFTYEWFLPASRASAPPKWRPEKGEEPPLSLMKAIAIARKAGEPWERLESVSILSIPGAEDLPAFRGVFYYKLLFKVEEFDRR